MMFFHILPALILLLALQVILQIRTIRECLEKKGVHRKTRVIWIAILLLGSLPGIVAYLLSSRKKRGTAIPKGLSQELEGNIEESLFLGLLTTFVLYAFAIVRVNPGHLLIAGLLTACLAILTAIRYLPRTKHRIVRAILPYLLASLVILQDYLSASAGYRFIVLITVGIVIIEYPLAYIKHFFLMPLVVYQAVSLHKYNIAMGYPGRDFVIGFLISNIITYCFVVATFYFAKKQLIQNTQLHALMKELKDKNIQLEEASVLKERNRIAREIHDTLGHSLTGAIIQLEVARKLIDNNPDKAKDAIQKTQEITRAGFGDVKRAIRALRPSGIDEASLAEGLSQLIKRVDSHFQFEIIDNIRLPEGLEERIKIHVYRIVQELVTNSIRHGNASQMRLDIDYQGSILRINSHDNGTGCEKFKEGNGLGGIRERVELMEGQVYYSSKDQMGFTALIHIPV